MPYLCGFADSMLQKGKQKGKQQKGGALELYSSTIRREQKCSLFIMVKKGSKSV